MKKLKKLLAKPQQELIRDKKSERNLFARRALVSFIFVWVLTAILATNLYHLQIVNYDSYQTRSMVTALNCYPFRLPAGLSMTVMVNC